MKILIVDDDINFSKQFSIEISNFFYTYESDVSISIFNTGFFDLNCKEQYHYAFIDINLKGANGIDISNVLKEHNPTCNIVFISAKSNLIHSSLTVQPFFFIRKTHYEHDLNIFFNLVKKSIVNKTMIQLAYKSKKVAIKITDITYIESHQHILYVHTLNYSYEDNRSLKEISNLLPEKFFCQIHRSFFVNLYYVHSYSRGEILLYTNGSEYTKLIISRSFQKLFENKYQEYLLL